MKSTFQTAFAFLGAFICLVVATGCGSLNSETPPIRAPSSIPTTIVAPTQISTLVPIQTPTLVSTQTPTPAPNLKIIDFETPPLNGTSRRVVNPYLDAQTGVAFTTESLRFNDAVVGVVKNSAASACVEPIDDNQRLGTGRDAPEFQDGAIGLSGFFIKATFPAPLSPPVTVSVEFQTVEGQPVRLILVDASGKIVGVAEELALPPRGTCGNQGPPRASKTLTVSTADSVATAIMSVPTNTPRGGHTFSIDDFKFSSQSAASVAPNPIAEPTPTPMPSPTPREIPEPFGSCESVTQTPHKIQFDRSKLLIESPLRSPAPEESIVIGRVLNQSPLIVEAFPPQFTIYDPNPKYEIRSFRVTPESVEDVATLELHDLIEITLVDIYLSGGPPDGDPAFGRGVKSVRKIGDRYEDLAAGDVEHLVRGRVLVYYQTTGSTDSNRLIIYDTGKMFYEEKSGNVVMRQSLSESELESLLTVFTESGFDRLENTTDLGKTFFGPSVSLACSRLQTILVTGNEEALRPITTALDSIVSGLKERFDIFVVFGANRRVNVTPWPYPDIQLADHGMLSAEALAVFRSAGTADGHILLTTVPSEILGRLPPRGDAFGNGSVYWDSFFTEDGNIYSVFRSTCQPNHTLCIDGNFYALRVLELAEPVSKEKRFGLRFRLWPDNLGPTLALAPDNSALVDPVIYEKNRAFYDIFFGDLIFLQGDYLFDSIKLVKRER